MLTIPRDDWEPHLPDGVCYCKGQPELGDGGYKHWQILAYFTRKRSLAQVKECFPATSHCEPTRSTAAENYVHKEETRDGEAFEFGSKASKRNSATDWDAIKESAKNGRLEDVPSDVYIRYYRTLRCIAGDHDSPVGVPKEVFVFVGESGTGKSHRAWAEAGASAYSKDPRTKFWCGYKGQENVVIDEFRGGIDVAHMLRWLDKYPVSVEVKGSSVPLRASRIWITSNLDPAQWYPELDTATLDALRRRIQVTRFREVF